MKNLVQFGIGLYAFGCKLNYNSIKRELDIVDSPARTKRILDDALRDIEHYVDTATYEDGLATLAVSNLIDGTANPLTRRTRQNILDSLGFTQGEKFIAQALNTVKTTRSWHSSLIQNSCSYFGAICVNRGTSNEPGKRGRKSTRKPNEYHVKTSRGIAREQLVTPNVAALFDAIPENVLISAPKRFSIDFESAKNMSKDDAERLLTILQGVLSGGT